MENLFDLSKLGSQYSGYFVDREGKVYSNKQGTLRALKVSAPSNTFNKYWNLSTNGYAQAVRTDRFEEMLNRSDEYRSFVKAPKSVSAPAATMSKGFIVLRERPRHSCRGGIARHAKRATSSRVLR